MDHHPKQITLNQTRDCMSAALYKALNTMFSVIFYQCL